MTLLATRWYSRSTDGAVKNLLTHSRSTICLWYLLHLLHVILTANKLFLRIHARQSDAVCVWACRSRKFSLNWAAAIFLRRKQSAEFSRRYCYCVHRNNK